MPGCFSRYTSPAHHQRASTAGLEPPPSPSKPAADQLDRGRCRRASPRPPSSARRIARMRLVIISRCERALARTRPRGTPGRWTAQRRRPRARARGARLGGVPAQRPGAGAHAGRPGETGEPPRPSTARSSFSTSSPRPAGGSGKRRRQLRAGRPLWRAPSPHGLRPLRAGADLRRRRARGGDRPHQRPAPLRRRPPSRSMRAAGRSVRLSPHRRSGRAP